MKRFLDKDFLLQNDVAQELYHNYAKSMPIIDYHCHLSAKDIAEDRIFNNLTEIWLEGDHYKWRAMRTNGVEEHYITGDAPANEKFQKWAETVPDTLRNPLYHWTHLELQRYFDINTILNRETASEIFEEANKKLSTKSFSVRNILSKMNVQVICTTDDPTDDLSYHKKIKTDDFGIKVLPTFRPDKAYTVEDPEQYLDYIRKLSSVCKIEINSYETLIQALAKRIEYFHINGCRLSDHGLNYLPYEETSKEKLNKLFKKILIGKTLDTTESDTFKCGVLLELGRLYANFSWVQQFHLGALRNNSTRMMNTLGPDTGFDSIADFSQAESLSRFLNHLDQTDELAKTILYNLNPADNEVFASMIGNFNDGSIPGKMQFGSGWWFLDQRDGMEKQINTLSNLGLLSRFVGMLTDSRSFMSFPRHEYFRRILCNLIGEDVEKGELPYDIELLGKMVENICFNNARAYFDFDKTSVNKSAVKLS